MSGQAWTSVLLFLFPALGWQACTSTPNFYWLRWGAGGGVMNFLPGLALKCHPLSLCLPSS
jgi:hypothetical protein